MGFIYPAITLQVYCFLKACDADIMFTKFKHINIYKDAPKVWHGYIRILILRCLKQLNISNMNNKKLPAVLFRHLVEYLKFKTQNMKKDIIKYDVHVLDRGNYTEFRIHKYVTFPLSILYLHHLKRKHYHFRSSSLNYYYKPHPLFRLNLTFHMISIFHSELGVCGFFGLKALVVCSYYRNLNSFIFKGHYATFCLFPKFKNVHLRIYNLIAPLFFNGNIEVMDKGLVDNFPVYHTYVIPTSLDHHITGQGSLLSFFLQVSKLDQIFIQFLGLMAWNYIIFDGPGILCNTLKSQPFMKCSSFQCLIYLLTRVVDPVWLPIITDFRFHSKSLNFSDSISIDQDTHFSVSLSKKNISSNILILFLNTNYGFQVNVTITTLMSWCF